MTRNGMPAHFRLERRDLPADDHEAFKNGEASSRLAHEVQVDIFPALAKAGWTRHQERWREATFDGADGRTAQAR